MQRQYHDQCSGSDLYPCYRLCREQLDDRHLSGADRDNERSRTDLYRFGSNQR